MACRLLCVVSNVAWVLIAFVVVQAPAALAEPFRAGVIVPLSGPVAEYGTAISNGIALAQETRPEVFSKCEFTVEDSAYKTTQALSALQKLQTTNKVNLVYVFGGPMGEALAPLAESKRMPLIIESPTALVDANGALEGALYPNNIIDEEFRRRYLERFRNEAQIKFGAEGYDVAMMLGEQFCSRPRQEWQTPEGVMNLLIAVPKRHGAQGETEFKVSADGDRYFSAPVVTKVASKTGFLPE